MNIKIGLWICTLCMLATACIQEQFDVESPNGPHIDVSNEIKPMAHIVTPVKEELPPYATKSLVSAQTTRHLQTQFLRIDEQVDNQNKGLYTFPSWDNGYLTEASIISSPSNQDQGYMRSILLNPIQTYKIHVKVDPQDPNKSDTTFYHTRFISWHPITCPLHKENGVASLTQFNHFKEANVGYDGYTINPDNSISINFRNLNGETDIMVSEVREGQHWHNFEKPGNNSSDYHPIEIQNSIYRQPFGRNEENPAYNNCFKYQHYLSAVKVYAFAQNSSQNAAMWGRIKKVVVREQPGSCSVTIPDISVPTIEKNNPQQPIENRIYGQATFSKTDIVSFPLIKTPIFGNDTNADNLETAPDNPTLEGTSKEKKIYLGYSLIAPEQDVILDIHTESGIFSVKVKWQQEEKDAEGNVISTTNVFKPGFIYNIVLNFGTGGTIAAILLNDADGIFYDLSTGETFGEGNQIYRYKTANSYIVDPTLQYEDKQGAMHYYDGYTFLASTIGNGNDGLMADFPQKTSTIDPVTAGIVWESKLGLITQVEYMYNYVRFKVQPPTKTGEFDEGNAVIGVYDEKGKMLWSWHIWITDKPQQYVIKLGNQNIGIMDRNLGATSVFANEKGGELSTYGLYYQWGRKDPSMPPPEANYRPLSTATSPYYDYYGNELHSTEIVTRSKPTIEDGIQNPMYMVLPTTIPPYYSYDWLYYRVNNLWGTAQLNQKTIYDPCPFGYRVPGEELRSLLSKFFNQATLSGNAYIYSVKDANEQDVKMAFPLAGYKGVDRGISSLTAAWKYVGEKGDYMCKTIYPEPNNHRGRTYLSKTAPWTETGAAAGNDGYGSKEFTYNNKIFTDFANRRTAASVRCVADDALEDIGQVFPFIDIPALILLGEEHYLTWGAKCVGGKLKKITLTESGKRNNTINVSPNTNNYTADPYPLPGNVKNQFSDMGEYTYNIIAVNDMDVEANRTKVVPVINLTEVYNIQIGGDNPNSDFTQGAKEFLSFKVNMREAGTTGQNNTTPEDLELLFNATQTWINNEHVGALYNKDTQTFTTKKPVALNGDLTLECRAKDGRVLKRYLMTMTETEKYSLGEQFPNTTEGHNALNRNGTLFTASLADDNTKYWWHTGSSTNKKNTNPKALQIKELKIINTLSDGTKIIDPHHVFKYEDTHKIKIMCNNKYLGDYFGAVNTPYEYYFDPGFYFGGTGPHWIIPLTTAFYPINVLQNTDYLNWMYDGNTPITGSFSKGTKWNVFKVEKTITYSAPVEQPVTP